MFLKQVGEDKPINGKESLMTRWKSDWLIVPRKPDNTGGGKGPTGQTEREGDMDQTREGTSMETKLAVIRERTRQDPKRRWTTLVHLLNEANLKECFYELRRAAAPGIDGVGLREYEERFDEKLADLVRRLKQKAYRPQPERRVHIPKDRNLPRPLSDTHGRG